MRAATWLIEVSGRPIPDSISYDLTVRASTDEHAAMMFSGLAQVVFDAAMLTGHGTLRMTRRGRTLWVTFPADSTTVTIPHITQALYDMAMEIGGDIWAFGWEIGS